MAVSAPGALSSAERVRPERGVTHRDVKRIEAWNSPLVRRPRQLRLHTPRATLRGLRAWVPKGHQRTPDSRGARHEKRRRQPGFTYARLPGPYSRTRVNGTPSNKVSAFGVDSRSSNLSRSPTMRQRYVATSPGSPGDRTLKRLPTTVMNRRVVGASCCCPT